MIFYDFEVFQKDWLVVLLDMENEEETVIVNDRDQLVEFYKRNQDAIWVGFNNRHYDQYILKAILCDIPPKRVNDWIIQEGKSGWSYSDLFRDIALNNYDVMLSTDKGLKVFEGYLGNDIKESSVPFDIQRRLTVDEIQETIRYCRHDVEQTVEIFLRRKEEFDVMMYFIKEYRLPLSTISKTKPQLAALLLGGNGKGSFYKDEFQFPILDCLALKKYQYVADWYKDTNHHSYNQFLETTIAGVPHKFSWGGGHGSRDKIHETGIFLIIDVTAYYPSEQMQFKFGYRVMDCPENFEFIHNSNIRFKRLGDKKARYPFKIMDNAISGQMKQPSSRLYDPMSNNSITINGQLLLLDLIEHLEPYCNLMQNNTDGILIQLRNYNDFEIIDDIVHEWEQRTSLNMDFETYIGDLYQKDVNNYLIVDRETGAMKSKGAYVKKLSSLDYDLAIVNKALVQYMVHHIPVEETIMNCDDFIEFQMIRKISNKYECILHGGRIERKSASSVQYSWQFAKQLKEKCVRCFASKGKEGLLGMVHKETKSIVKIANTPENCFLYNEAVKNLPCPNNLDKQWYVNLAKKRLRDFGVL